MVGQERRLRAGERNPSLGTSRQGPSGTRTRLLPCGLKAAVPLGEPAEVPAGVRETAAAGARRAPHT